MEDQGTVGRLPLLVPTTGAGVGQKTSSQLPRVQTDSGVLWPELWNPVYGVDRWTRRIAWH